MQQTHFLQTNQHLRRVRVLFEEKSFDDTIDYNLDVDLSLNIFQVMLKTSHDFDFDSMRKTIEDFTFLTSDNEDLREAS